MSPSRPMPYVGMHVHVVHLGTAEAAVVDAVLDDGRTLVVGTDTYTLRRLTGHFVRAEDPYYGVRLALDPPDADQSA
ncbi:MAG TPA: hypothetical protein VGM33_08790 [Baekduia sp.]